MVDGGRGRCSWTHVHVVFLICLEFWFVFLGFNFFPCRSVSQTVLMEGDMKKKKIVSKLLSFLGPPVV